MSSPATLLFPARRSGGSFPVTDDQGRLVARITTTWSANRFTVTEPDGRHMCQAWARWWGLSSVWRAAGEGGEPLLSVRPGLLWSRATIQLERGPTLVVRGSAWRRDFTVHDAEGRVVLEAEPRTSAWSWRRHEYAVHQPLSGVLLLPETITAVQIWRMVKKAEDAAGGAVAATAATTAT